MIPPVPFFRIRRGGVLLLFGMGLAACARSPPTHFFALAAVRADQPDAQFAGAPVQVRAVHIPALLDRTELVSEPARDSVDVHQFDQWGAPLADMMRQVLSQDLSARLPAGMVVPPQSPSPPHTRGLVIDVQEYQPEQGGQVVLDASWSLLDGTGGAPTLRRQRRLQAAAGDGVAGQVATMSQLLGRLADEIAQSLKSAS